MNVCSFVFKNISQKADFLKNQLKTNGFDGLFSNMMIMLLFSILDTVTNYSNYLGYYIVSNKI